MKLTAYLLAGLLICSSMFSAAGAQETEAISIPTEAVAFKLDFDDGTYSAGQEFRNLGAGNNASAMQQPSFLPEYYEGHRVNPCDVVGGALVIGEEDGNKYMESRLVCGSAGPQVNTYAIRNSMPEYDSFISFRYKSTATTPEQLKFNRVYIMHCFDGNGIDMKRALTLNFDGVDSQLNGLVSEFVHEGNGTKPQNVIIPVTQEQFMEWHTYGIRIYRSEDGYVMYDGYFDGKYVSTVKSSLEWIGNQMTFASLRIWGGTLDYGTTAQYGAGGGCIDDFVVCNSTDFLPAVGGPVIPEPTPAPDNIPEDAPFTVKDEQSFVSENFDTMTSAQIRPSYWLPYFGIGQDAGKHTIVDNPSGEGKVLQMDVSGVGNAGKRGGPYLDIENGAQMADIEDSDVFISYKLYSTRDAVFQMEVAVGGEYNKKDTGTVGATEQGYSRYKFGTYNGSLVQGKNLQNVAYPTTEYERWHTFGIHIYRIPDVELDQGVIAKAAMMDYYFDGERYSSKKVYLSRFAGDLERLKFMGFQILPYSLGSTGSYTIYMDDLRVDYVETDPSIYPQPPVDREVPTPPPVATISAEISAAASDGVYRLLQKTGSNLVDFGRELRASIDVSRPYETVFLTLTQEDTIVELQQARSDENGHITFTLPARTNRSGAYTLTVGGNNGVVGESYLLTADSALRIDISDIAAGTVYVDAPADDQLPQSPIVVLAAMKDERLIDVWIETLPVAEENIRRAVFSEVQVQNCELKAFVFEGMSTLKPLCGAAAAVVE